MKTIMQFRIIPAVTAAALFCLSAPAPASFPDGRVSLTSSGAAQPHTAVTLTEDTTWKGTMEIRGAVIIAPQATLRIEPGTVVRFTPAKGERQLPRLIIQGRLQAAGSNERPILLTADRGAGGKPGWGGVMLLSSEKRNRLEFCRIEGAETALDGRFSSLSAKELTLARSTTGCLFRDSVVTLSGVTVTSCETGIEAHDSEVGLDGSIVTANRRGCHLTRSSLSIKETRVTDNSQSALSCADCRLSVDRSDISGNGTGISVTGGEGQIVLSRIMRNRDTALHLADARVKINRCRISDNLRDGVRMDDERAQAWGNIISGNGGHNLLYTGRDRLNVPLNWWGTAQESALQAKLAASATQHRAAVSAYPWLTEAPDLTP